MDLRKLRERPESELWQFKNARKNRPSPVIFLIMGTLLISAIIIGLTTFFWAAQREKQRNEKKYRTIQLPKQQGDETPASGSTVETTDTSSISETLTPSRPTEDNKGSQENGVGLESPESTPVPLSPEKEKGATDEAARRPVEPLAYEKSEVDKMLAETDELLNRSRTMLNQAIPMVVNHLNTLSPEEQMRFLNHIRSQMFNHLPPDARDFMEGDPELAEKGWQHFLILLQEHGFNPPD